MKICDGKGFSVEHEEICFDGDECPLCEALEIGFDVFWQACLMNNDKIDHMEISAYKRAQKFFIEENWLNPDDCKRF